MQADPLNGPPWQTFETHSGHGWMPGTAGSRSPVRYTRARSGSVTSAPPPHEALPLASCATSVRIHALIGTLAGSGTATGAPNWQPERVQLRDVPVTACDVGPSVNRSVTASHPRTSIVK